MSECKRGVERKEGVGDGGGCGGGGAQSGKKGTMGGSGRGGRGGVQLFCCLAGTRGPATIGVFVCVSPLSCIFLSAVFWVALHPSPSSCSTPVAPMLLRRARVKG